MFCNALQLLQTRPSTLPRRNIAYSPRKPTYLRLAHRATWLEDKTRIPDKLTTPSAVAESKSAFDVESSPIDEIVKYLLSLGWEPAWIDGVTEKIAKKLLTTDVDTVKAACEFLSGLGIAQGQICNMVSLCYAILGHDVESHLRPVVDYLTKQGVTNLPKLLTMNSRLLDYKVSADGKQLEKGKLRTVVKVEKKDGKEVVGIVTYREGALFLTAPITPYSP